MKKPNSKNKTLTNGKANFHTLAKQVLKTAREHERALDALPPDNRDRKAYRSVFLSDFHLGSKRSQAEKLLAFLDEHDMENLYLVGDIVDGWRFRKFGHWPESHSAVLHKIFEKSRNGSRVIFTPGNHDHHFKNYVGRNVRGIELHHDVIHETADGRRFWVVHGDQFDKTAYVPDWVFHIADFFNRTLHGVNDGYNGIRKRLGMSRKCLATHLKNNTKRAEEFKQKFARLIAGKTEEEGYHGVICGHIHKAEKRSIGGVKYINTGDWVESCTALVEHFNGQLEIVKWNHQDKAEPLTPVLAAAE